MKVAGQWRSAWVQTALRPGRGCWWLLGLWGLLLGLSAPGVAQERPKKQAAKTIKARSTKALPARSRSDAQRQPSKSKDQLERERRANLRQIQQTSQALNQTQEKKKVSLGQLNIIKGRLTEKKEVIQGISTQLRGIETNVNQTAGQVLQTQQTLHELKDEYARLLYTASKTASGFNRLMFLFASDSFNQFALRLRYVRQYTEERQRQAARIVGTQQRLHQQLTGLTRQQRRKSSLLSSQLNENRSLLTLKSKEDVLVQQLSQQEQGLRQELEERRRSVVRLDNLIAERVREEIARAARVARLAARREVVLAAARDARRVAATRSAARSAASSTGPTRSRRDPDATASAPESLAETATAAPEADAPETAAETAADRRAVRIALTPETAVLSSSFAGNRGRLPWPVGRGFISQHFGRHPHPVLRNVTVENRGVDIQTGAGEAVRACFDGKVLTIANIAGMNTIVMIQHGDFFTVYAKLRNVSVREGQRVSAREVIGSVATDSEGTSELQFQVWHNSANLNPETWLGHR